MAVVRRPMDRAGEMSAWVLAHDSVHQKNLINTANLENVIMYILENIQSIDTHAETTDNKITGIQFNLDGRATNEALHRLQLELDEQEENINATFARQGEGIAKVQREATRLMCEAIEQKLEALLKDRAWQEGLTNGEQKGGKLDLELREEEQM